MGRVEFLLFLFFQPLSLVSQPTLINNAKLGASKVVQPHQDELFDDEELPTASPDEEQSGPSRRKRQPSMSESMPLYTLCKEDLESMDKEVDDILGEGSDDSDSEKKTVKVKKTQSTAQEKTVKNPEHSTESSSSSDRSLLGNANRGQKRKLEEEEEDGASESSKESSNEDEEGSSSEADEMAAALEAELNDFI